MDWQITLAARLDREPTDEDIGDLADTLDKYDAAVSVNSATVSVVMTIEDEHEPHTALHRAMQLVYCAVVGGNWVRAWTEAEAVAVEVADQRLAEPTIPDLVSGVEAAQILGVSRQRVHQLAAENASFPPPVARLASGSVWLRSGVEGFAQTWTRKPGRPAKAAS